MYDKVCKSCGYTLSAYYNTGYLGCPDCYREFEQDILASVKEVQGSTRHVGKKPVIFGVDRDILNDYQRYLKEKERAGIEGRFSDMAKINSILTQLSEELKRRGLM